ncbi:hypothetical protein As57867_017376, partial [Aphanomyces stellatus]
MESSSGDGAKVEMADALPPLNKATKAAWKKALKQLKLKDVGKKVEGIRYCAGDGRFFREAGGLPSLMAFLTRAKQHEILSQALAMFARLITSNEPDLLCPLNAVYILEEGLHPSTPWVGGEYFVAVVTMAGVDDDMKMTALKIYTKMVEHTLALPHDDDSGRRRDLLTTLVGRGDPIATILVALESANIEMQFVALTALFVLLCGHPDTDGAIAALDANHGVRKILSYVATDDPRFHLLALKLAEFLTHDPHGVEIGQVSCARVDGLATLTTKLHALVASLSLADLNEDNVCLGLDLTAQTLTRLHVAAPAASEVNNPTTGRAADDLTTAAPAADGSSNASSSSIRPTVDEWTPVTMDDESNRLLEVGVAQLVAALSTGVVKAKPRASTASVLLSSVGRLLERNAPCRVAAKKLSLMSTLVHYLVMDETSAAISTEATEHTDQQSVDVKAKPTAKGAGGAAAKGGKDPPKGGKDTTKPPEPVVPVAPPVAVLDSDGALDPAVADAAAKAKAEAAEKTRLTFLHVRNAAEKILHLCARDDGDVDGRVFGTSPDGDPLVSYDLFQAVLASPEPTTMLRGVRFLATAVQHPHNSIRLGTQATQTLLAILQDQTKAQEATADDTKRLAFAAVVGYISKCLVKLSVDTPDVCELCGDDVVSPVPTLVAYVIQHADDGALDALNPLNLAWGVADASISDVVSPALTWKPHVFAAQALATLARCVLDFAVQAVPKADDVAADKKVKEGKKGKEAPTLTGDKVAQRIATCSLKLLDLLAHLRDFDVHVVVLAILRSMPYIPGGRKTLLHQVQEQLALERTQSGEPAPPVPAPIAAPAAHASPAAL